MIEKLFLQLAWPTWLFVLAVIGVALLSLLYYSRTLPPLSSWRKHVAVILRAAALIIALFICLEPILELFFREHEKPVVAVLLDNSASMQIGDAQGVRGDSLRFILQNLAKVPGADSLELIPYTFAAQPHRWRGDSLRFAVDATNLTAAVSQTLDSLAGKNLAALVLISDGIYNQGTSPLMLLRGGTVPIYTVVIGDTARPKDLAVRRVQTNQITYVGKDLPVEVVFWQNGFDGQSATLKISHNGQPVASRRIRLGKSGLEQKELLNIRATTAGDFNYEISLENLAGEVTTHNNQQTVPVQVLKSKIKVLVLNGSPNYDGHFLAFAASSLRNFQFTFLAERSSGEYFERSFSTVPLDSQDVIILHGFPTPASNSDQLRTLFQTIQRRKLPLLWLPARSSDYQKLSFAGDDLPFVVRGPLHPLENQFAVMTAGGKVHPIMQLDEQETANELLWQDLPPVEIYPEIKERGGSQILLTARPEGEGATAGGFSLCYTFRHSETKHLVLNAANFGNWHFQLQEDAARDHFFVGFLERSLRWLVNREDIQQIQIGPLQPIYNLGESVIFSGQVYDQFYQPVADAEVRITLGDDSLRFTQDMMSEGSSYYRAVFSGVPQGEFNYTIEAHRGGNLLGSRAGKLTVKPFYLEFQQTRANFDLMKQVAEQSGGRIYRAAEFVKKFPESRLESRVQSRVAQLYLWNHWQWLMLLILLLGLEWLLRKRWGML